MFLRHPIRKLSVPINQSSYLIYFCYNFFDSANETNLYEIKSRRQRSQVLTCFIFLVLFSKKVTVSFQKATLQKHFVMVEEELNGVDTDDIGNLEDSPRFVFIDDECENFIIVNDGGEFTRNISQKKKSGVLGESISSVTMWNIMNQLGKHEFLVGQ